MDKSVSKISLNEAVNLYIDGLKQEEAGASRLALYKFIRWFGRERLLDGIRAQEVANFSGSITATDAENIKKLAIIRDFLATAKKKCWIENGLSVHLKVKRTKASQGKKNNKGAPETISLTKQGYDEMQSELAVLKEKRPGIVEDIKRAAADKDFRENAPLNAAREQLGHIEGRLKELEEILKNASVIGDREEEAHHVEIGDSVVLIELDSGEEMSYTIVSPKEVDPSRGKISNSSPLGGAIIGCGKGEVIEINVPVGKLCYRIEKIGGC